MKQKIKLARIMEQGFTADFAIIDGELRWTKEADKVMDKIIKLFSPTVTKKCRTCEYCSPYPKPEEVG